MKKFTLLLVSAFFTMGMVSMLLTNKETIAKTKTKEIMLAHNQPTEHPVHKSLKIFKDRLEKESHGQIKVNIYPNGQLGSEREAIEMTQTNAIQMTKVSAGALESFSPTYSLFNMPYLFESEDNYRHVMKRKNVQDAFFKSTGDQGFLGITYYDAGMRNIYTKDKEIKDNKDLKGLKIRVQPGKTSVDLIKSLGGTPTPMDYGEVYTAMQSGVIDAADYSTKKHEVIWDKAVSDSKKTATEKMDVKFHDVDKSTFKATSKPLQDEFKNNPDTKADYKLIEKEEQRYEKSKANH